MDDEDRLDFIDDLKQAIVELKMMEILHRCSGEADLADMDVLRRRELELSLSREIELTQESMLWRMSSWSRERRKRRVARKYRNLLRKGRNL